jgi:hypothetical protein
MCRIWIDGVPPGQQPAPTDCVTAERRRPANARVIYGDDTQRSTHRVYDDRDRVYRRDNDDADRNRVYRRDNDDDDRDRVYRRDNDDDRDGAYRRINDDDDRSGKKFKANKSKHGKGKGKHHD